MKLIIDIPEERYLYMKGMYHPTWAEEFIANGIPLDDIKIEILEKMADYVASGYADSAKE